MLLVRFVKPVEREHLISRPRVLLDVNNASVVEKVEFVQILLGPNLRLVDVRTCLLIF